MPVSSVFTSSTTAVALIFDCSDIREYTSGGITLSAGKQNAEKRKTSTDATILQRFIRFPPLPKCFLPACAVFGNSILTPFSAAAPAPVSTDDGMFLPGLF